MQHDCHSHNHHPPSYGWRFAVGAALNIVFIGFELYFGHAARSAGLLADAIHNLGDVLGLFISWLGFALARVRTSKNFTFGLKNATILASFINAILLFIGTGFVIKAGMENFLSRESVDSIEVMAVALLGIIVNGATALLFLSGSRGDINIKSAFLHMAFDALVSLGVVIGGAIIFFTGFYAVDAIIAILIGVFIIITSWGLFVESGKLLFAGAPRAIDSSKVREFLVAQDGVKSIHDLHIWAISTTVNAISLHVVVEKYNFNFAFLEKLEDLIKAKFHIHHITIQLEEPRQCREICA